MYKVTKLFTDLQDNKHRYNAGDIFPRKGLKVSEERFEELSTNKNRQHVPLIEKIEETEEIKGADVKPEKKSRKRAKDAGADS